MTRQKRLRETSQYIARSSIPEQKKWNRRNQGKWQLITLKIWKKANYVYRSQFSGRVIQQPIIYCDLLKLLEKFSKFYKECMVH